MTNTRKVPTAHGDVEVETVECTSCGQTVVKDDAKKMFVGDVHSKYGINSGVDYTDVSFAGTPRDGWVCPNCDESPAGFPVDPTLKQRIKFLLFGSL